MTNGSDPAFSSERVHLSHDPKYDDKYITDNHPEWIYKGLTKREHFAALAMSGKPIGETVNGIVAKECVAMADALIAELNK